MAKEEFQPPAKCDRVARRTKDLRVADLQTIANMAMDTHQASLGKAAVRLLR